MTIEEAIKHLYNDWFKTCGGQICIDSDKAEQYLEAIGMAITALRAQQELARDTNVHTNPPLTLGELRQMADEILSRGSSSYCRTCGIRRNCVIGPCARCDTKKVPPSEWVNYENPELTLYPQEAQHGSN